MKTISGWVNFTYNNKKFCLGIKLWISLSIFPLKYCVFLWNVQIRVKWICIVLPHNLCWTYLLTISYFLFSLLVFKFFFNNINFRKTWAPYSIFTLQLSPHSFSSRIAQHSFKADISAHPANVTLQQPPESKRCLHQCHFIQSSMLLTELPFHRGLSAQSSQMQAEEKILQADLEKSALECTSIPFTKIWNVLGMYISETAYEVEQKRKNFDH